MPHVDSPANLDLPRRRSIRLPGYDYAGYGTYFVTICADEGRCLFGRIADEAMWPNTLGELAIQEWLASAAVRPGVRLDHFVLMPNHFHGIVHLRTELGTEGAEVLPEVASDLPVGAGDLPVGAGDLPVGAGDLPVGAGDLPVGAGDLPVAPTADGLLRAGDLPVAPTADGLLRAGDLPVAPTAGPAKGSLGSLVGCYKAAVTRRARVVLGDPSLRVWQRGYYEHIIRDEEDLCRIHEYIIGNPACWESDTEYVP